MTTEFSQGRPRPSAPPRPKCCGGRWNGSSMVCTDDCTASTTADQPCPFCEIVAGRAPAEVVARWDDTIVIKPLNPVTSGHLLVIPTTHVMDALDDYTITARVMRRAAEIAPWPCNIITSAGPAATQTVFHLHVHVVPRRTDDGLPLPWTHQHQEAS